VKKRFLLMALVSLTALLWAQEPPPSESAAADFGFGLGLGTEVIDGETWQNLSFVPDLALGDLGIGLDLRINFQFYDEPGSPFGFYPRIADWKADSADFADWAELYLSKIAYIRWAKKGSPLYIKLGQIQDGTLGNGFMMANYNNTVLRPEVKVTGLAFDLDGKLFGAPIVGLETFTGNLIQPDVLGGRLFVRPLIWSGIPVFDNMQVGGSFITDLDPWRYSLAANPGNIKPVQAFGADVRVPIVNLENVFSLATFADASWVGLDNTYRDGQMFGFGGTIFSILTYGAQVRRLGADFVPTYFDRGYDLKRDANYQIVNGALGIQPYMGWLASIGFNLFNDEVVFYSSLEGPLGEPSANVSNVATLYPKLRSRFLMDMESLPVTVEAYYDKDNIRDLATLFSAEDALVGARVGYKAGPAVVALVYNLRYLPATSTWEITSKLETVVEF